MIMRQRAPLLVPGRGLPPLGGPAPLRTGAREGAMRARDMRPDQNLSADGHGHLRIQMINWRNTLAPATHFLLPVSIPMFFIPSLTPLRTVFWRIGCCSHPSVREAHASQGAGPSPGLRRGCFPMRPMLFMPCLEKQGTLSGHARFVPKSENFHKQRERTPDIPFNGVPALVFMT